MIARLLQLLELSRDEWPLLRTLAALFVLTSAAATLTASAAKAMFLTAYPLSALPWVLMAQALWGLTAALVYTKMLPRFDATRRFVVLVALAVISFSGLWALFREAPGPAALISAVWAPGLVQLAIIQTWSLPTSFLPGRASKRIIPLLAAAATFGAAAGGALTRVSGEFLRTEDLLLVSGAILAVVGPLVPGTVRRLRVLAGPDRDRTSHAAPSLRGGLGEIVRSPLLSRLAAVVALGQFVSVLLDYQFSGELKARFALRPDSKEALSAFLGTFYWVGNLLVLGVSLLATQRLVRVLGLGLCISGVSLLIGLGSGAYLVGALTAAFPPFYALVATATSERVGQFALSRNAGQMLLAPLDPKSVERARALLDGVAYRGASLLASLALLAVGTLPLPSLTAPILLGSIGVVLIGLSIEPHYRKALYDALGTGRLEVSGAQGRVALDASAQHEISRALNSDNDEKIVRGLALVRAMGAAPDIERVQRLAARGTDPVTPAAIETLKALNVPLAPDQVSRLLRPDLPAAVLRASLACVSSAVESDDLRAAVESLRNHPDPTVAALARVAGVTRPPPPVADLGEAVHSPSGADLAEAIDAPPGADETGLNALLNASQVEVRREVVKLLGQGAADAVLLPLLRALEDPSVRDETIDALSRFGPRLSGPAAELLASDALSETAQVALLHALSRTNDPTARDVLMGAVDQPKTALRNAATRGLWRMAANERLRPDAEWLVAVAGREIELIRDLLAAEASLPATGRPRFLRDELHEQSRMAERRIFGLLGLLYGRSELHRALCHLHSENARSRSNAIELLDQKLRHPQLRPFIELVEGRQTNAPGSVPVLADVVGCPAVLVRLERWTRGGDDPGLDKAWLLRRVDLFGAASAEALTALGADVTVTTLQPGASVAVKAGVLLVLEGQGVLRPSGRTLTEGDVAGALESLAGQTSDGEFTVDRPTTVAVVPAAALETHLINHPGLVRGLLQRLGGRLRAINLAGQAGPSPSPDRRPGA